MEVDELAWEEAKRRCPVGSRVRAIVNRHAHFGMFVMLQDPPIWGLINIPDIVDEGRMTPELYPPLGESIEAVVLGHNDSERQLALSMKPSQLT